MNPEVRQIHHPIEITPQMLESWYATKKERNSDDNTTGIFDIDLTWARETFLPILKKLGLDMEITKVWVHYMKKGGFRTPHEHGHTTGLYYAIIPEGSGKMVLLDDNTTVEPIEGDFYLLPKDVQHKITTHESDEMRWAIAFDCKKKIY